MPVIGGVGLKLHVHYPLRGQVIGRIGITPLPAHAIPPPPQKHPEGVGLGKHRKAPRPSAPHERTTNFVVIIHEKQLNHPLPNQDQRMGHHLGYTIGWGQEEVSTIGSEDECRRSPRKTDLRIIVKGLVLLETNAKDALL